VKSEETAKALEEVRKLKKEAWHRKRLVNRLAKELASYSAALTGNKKTAKQWIDELSNKATK